MGDPVGVRGDGGVGGITCRRGYGHGFGASLDTTNVSGEFHGKFDWRFNDVSAKVPDQIECRRTVPLPDFGMKTT
jgi:hypothetical protein